MKDLLVPLTDSSWPLLGTILLAALLGGLIGFEREFRAKSAGLRTNILICVGSALLTEMSMRIAASAPGVGDPGRIASYVVGGIGFLGAGVIWQARGKVNGMTTAATIWMVAAIGVTIGGGEPGVATAATLFVLMTLAVLGRFEGVFEDRLRAHVVHITLPGPSGEARDAGTPRDGPVRRALSLLAEEGFDPTFIRSTVKGEGFIEVTCRVRARDPELRATLLSLAEGEVLMGVAVDPD